MAQSGLQKVSDLIPTIAAKYNGARKERTEAAAHLQDAINELEIMRDTLRRALRP